VDGQTDYGDPIPGSRRAKYFKASGIIHIGNDQLDGSQLWVNKRDALTHFMVFGGTGSGKTEVLVSFASNYLLLSSGIVYVDPKAAAKLAYQMYSLCRMLWRDHDYRLMNYMTNTKRDSSGYVHPIRNSNTSNPFNKGSSEQATSILGSLLAAAEGPNAVFQNNAQNLVAGLMRGLVELRDEHRSAMDVRVIRDHISSANYHKVATDDRLRKTTKDSMMAFLRSMGFVETQPYEKQSASFHQQYGYAQAYFSQPLNSLTDSYGYIFGRSSMGEVDFEDVIKQRRVLIVMLPSLAKSPAELASLGKVILGGLRNAVSVGLGDRIEGTVQDTMDASPMAAKYPFGAFIDEYAAIATEGFVQVLTQGRGLGISALIGTQDYAGLKHASEVEAQQAVENTTVKLFGKMDTGETTFELLKKIAGDMDVAANSGMEMKDGASAYFDQGRTSYSRVSRIELLDLQRQIEGEFHTYFRGSLIRANVFYANPRLKKKDQLRINAMLPIPWPTEKEASDAAGHYTKAVDLLTAWMDSPEAGRATESTSPNFCTLAVILGNESVGGRERGASAVAKWSGIADAAGGSAGGRSGRRGGGGGNGLIVEDQKRNRPAEDALNTLEQESSKVAVDAPIPEATAIQDEAVKPIESIRRVSSALDDLDDMVCEALDPKEADGEASTVEIATPKESAAVSDLVTQAVDQIDYPLPPSPPILRHDDAKKLVKELRSRFMP
jgi:intracellular multiplication protein IcmO